MFFVIKNKILRDNIYNKLKYYRLLVNRPIKGLVLFQRIEIQMIIHISLFLQFFIFKFQLTIFFPQFIKFI